MKKKKNPADLTKRNNDARKKEITELWNEMLKLRVQLMSAQIEIMNIKKRLRK